MSNLLKSRNFVCANNKKKVIDYNEMISEKIAQLQRKIEKDDNEEVTSGDFVEGIDAQSVEMLLTEESNVIHENNNAKEKADEIIALANSDAEAIIEKAKQDAEAIKQAAMAEGRNEGYNEGKVDAAQQIEELKRQLEDERTALENEYEKKVSEIEPMLVDTILKVFEKVTHVLTEDKKDLVLNLVEAALTGTEINGDFIVRVSSSDYKFLIDNKEKIRSSVPGNVQVEIVEDPTFTRGQCMIESDSGIYDCSLDIQLEGLINSIKVMSCMAE